MGGSGSGRWRAHSKRDTVEDCLVLTCGKLVRDRLLSAGLWNVGSLTWRNTRTGEVTASMRYVVNTRDLEDSWIRLQYQLGRKDMDMDYQVRLVTSRPNYGGLRWWFICPIAPKGGQCNRRVSKLYLPPGQEYYGCRHCYDLTYESSQESHAHDALYASLAGGIPGLTGGDVKRMLSKRWGL